jgi:hypothetical protein
MKTQGKNQLLAIVNSGRHAQTTKLTVRIDESLWADFAVYAELQSTDRSKLIIEFIEDCVSDSSDRIKQYKDLKKTVK